MTSSKTWLAVVPFAALGAGLLLLPSRWALPERRWTAVEGIETLNDAVAACRATGLRNWQLVTLAQRLVYRKFAYYSCRNLWDTPAQAFRRGMGYCSQYNLALKQILERLGFDVQAVFSPKVRVVDNPDWSMGHTWLRVQVGDEIRTVCAGHADNLPGQVHFTPLAPVWPGKDAVLFFSHLGMILFCGYLEWRAILTRQPVPRWMFQDRAHTEAATSPQSKLTESSLRNTRSLSSLPAAP